MNICRKILSPKVLSSMLMFGGLATFGQNITQNFEESNHEWYVVPNSGNLTDTIMFWGFYNKNLLTTAAPDTSDRHTGIIESPVFKLSDAAEYDGKVTFFQGGGDKSKYRGKNECYVAVYKASDNTEIMRTYSSATREGVAQTYDLKAYKGQNIYFRLVDNHSGGWGHAALDDIKLQGSIDKAATFARRPALEIAGYQPVSDVLVSLGDKSSYKEFLPTSLIVESTGATRPVTWTDNDGYNSKVNGDYNFTAKLGALPKGELRGYQDNTPENVTVKLMVRTNAALDADAKTIVGTLNSADLSQAGKTANINDSHACTGIKWDTTRTDYIETVELTLKKSTDKMAEPIIQASNDGGKSWVTIGQSNNFRGAVKSKVMFTITKPLTGVNALRVVGLNDNSLKGSELKVMTAAKKPANSQTLPKYDVTITDLLDELVDRDAKTVFPNDYTLGQFSSYERKSDKSSAKEGADGHDSNWYANFDFSYFLRMENNNGRTEYVMMDHAAPGAITRWWMTFITSDFNDNSIIRVYIDGSETPVIEEHPMELLSRGEFGGKVLASSSSPQTREFQRGHNLYLPIPYSTHCKVTIETSSLDGTINEFNQAGGTYVYYNINYRDYSDNISIQPFTKGDIDIRPALMKGINEELLNAAPSVTSGKKSEGTIASGKTATIPAITGAKSIKKITAKFDAQNINQALRSTVLSIKFDGKESVWIPVGEFFGTGYKICPYKSRYTEVLKDGIMTASWVMPFADKAEISLINYGDQDVKYTLDVVAEDREWSADSLYFHAKWREYNRFKSKGNRNHHEGNSYDLNYIDIKGKGVYIGDTLTLFNTAVGSDYGNWNLWWGEGDEKIYVDGETFPSHFGTGTEDYYGYAWCRPQKFHTPFITQPDGSGNKAPGFTVNSRYRILDDLPFSKSLKFDMELWTWKTCTMNFAPAVFYYAEKSSTDNIEKDIANVKKAVILTRDQMYNDSK